MAKKLDFSLLKGPEKAAALLLALGEEQSAKILSFLGHDEIKEISKAMTQLGTVGSEVIENLCIEFSSQISSSGSLVGSLDTTERFLRRVMDAKTVNAIMDDIRGPAGRTMWDKLGNINETILANFLKNEHPQTVAVVLSKIKSEHASRVLSVLPEEFAIEVITRLLNMENVKKEILNDIEKTLRTEFMSNLVLTNKQNPYELMAEIFNNFDRATENRFMSALEKIENSSAEKIKSLMFTFDDLIKLDGPSVQAVLRKIDKDKLSTALKTASQEIKDLFFGNMSERAAKIMKEDMAASGPVRLKDVEQAQNEIIITVKEMAHNDEIIIMSGNAEDEMVV